MRMVFHFILYFSILEAMTGSFTSLADELRQSDSNGIRLIYDEKIEGASFENNKSGIILEDGETRSNQIGGLGGAISYTGKGNIYIMTPDRGPGAGETSYKERFYFVEINPPSPKSKHKNNPRIVGMHYLRKEKGIPFTGDASAYDQTNSKDSLRLDAEGVRIAPNKNHLIISDEYGPFIYEFDIKSGIRVRSINIPKKFLIDIPSKKGKEETEKNISGRQSNRGFEGLAITPSGNRLFAITQDPLIQDCDNKYESRLYGTKNRLLEISLKHGAYREYEYILDSPENGVSEILSIDDNKMLALERDNMSGKESRSKKVYLVNIDGATNIHEIPSLSKNHQEAEIEITPVKKKLLIDLQKIGINDIPEKVEGMTFGPDLDEKTSLLVI